MEHEVPCRADHRPEVPMRRHERLSGDAEGYLHGCYDVHAHLGVWWRLPDDADLHTTHFCACFYGRTGLGDFGGENAEIALGDNLDEPSVHLARTDLRESFMDCSMLVGIRCDEQEQQRGSLLRSAAQMVRLRLLNDCEQFRQQTIRRRGTIDASIPRLDAVDPLLLSFISRELDVFDGAIWIAPQDERAEELVKGRTRVVNEVPEIGAPHRAQGLYVPPLKDRPLVLGLRLEGQGGIEVLLNEASPLSCDEVEVFLCPSEL